MIGLRELADPEIDRAFRHLHRRGPDDRGVWRGDGAVLGMTRLAIVDVGGGHQPMFDPSGRYAIVFNGEIYNHIELRQELEARGHVFQTHSDTETLLMGFCADGPAVLEKLNGIFAFAIYDQRERKLFLARDRLGVKPLHIHHDGANLYFASSAEVLRDWLGLGIDPDAVLSYLTWSFVPAPQSIYAKITKVAPGQFLWSDGRNVQSQVYWRATRRLGQWQGTVAEAPEPLDALLADSLRLQVRSDVPIGIFLSGGVDSSAVLHYARRALSGRIRTFTIHFAEKGGQDAEMARLVAAEMGADCVEIRVEAQATADLLKKSIQAMDEPFADTAFLPTLEISRVACAEGIKVLLGGAGGDEIFGGYSRHWPAKRGRVRWFAETLEATGIGRLGDDISRAVRSDKLKRVLSPATTLSAEISGANFGFLHACLARPGDYRTIFRLVAAEHEATRADQAFAGYHYARMLADLRNYLVNNVLAIADQGSMGASVEGRVPLLDHRLVEFCFSLPTTMNLLGVERKGLFRSVLRSRIPAAVLNRPKEGFNGPARSWVEHGLKENFARLRDAPASIISAMIGRDQLQRWLQSSVRRRAAAHSLYGLVVLNEWCHVRRV